MSFHVPYIYEIKIQDQIMGAILSGRTKGNIEQEQDKRLFRNIEQIVAQKEKQKTLNMEIEWRLINYINPVLELELELTF